MSGTEVAATAPLNEVEVSGITPAMIQGIVDRVPRFGGDVEAVLANAQEIKAVEGIGDLELASVALRDLAKIKSAITSHYDPFKKSAHALHRGITGECNAAVAPIETEDGRVRRLCTDWQRREDERIRRERMEAERKAREEQAERERAAQLEAERLAAEGRQEEAEQVIEQAVSEPVMPAIPPPQPTPSYADTGMKSRLTYRAEITDKRALLTHVLTNYDALQHLVDISQSNLNALARAQKTALKLPGVRVAEERGLSVNRG